MRQNIGLALLFSLVATLCDRTWVEAGTLWYPGAPPSSKQAWWVPLLFAAVGLIAVYFAKWVTFYFVPNDTPPPTDPMATFAVSAALFVAAYLACGLWDQTRARRVAVILVAVWLVRFALQRPRWREAWSIVLISGGIALVGCLAEIGMVWLEMLRYERPFLWGLPAWLPALYIHAGFLARDIARAWFGGR
jgi:hypothetical protein